MNKPNEIPILTTRLLQQTSGQIFSDSASRGRYATDASIYQTMPKAVFIPKTADDVVAAIGIAAELSVPILARGGGTSQCGQTTGAALVIDNSPHFRKLLHLDLEEKTVEVEPGMVLDHLNQLLKPHQLWFPVDVSTSGQATIGGMAGNNSCGSRSIQYGNMVHNVLGIDAWLADGTLAQFGKIGHAQGRALELGNFVQTLAEKYQSEIITHWPKVLRRVAGYNLDIFDNQSEKPYTADGHVNLAHLLVGSEGTLGYFKKLKLQLSPLPSHKVLGVINFVNFHQAMQSAQHIVKLGPCAVELVDRTMIDLARHNPVFKKVIETGLIDKTAPTPEAILLVEFAGDELKPLIQQVNDLTVLMSDLGHPNSVVQLIDPSAQKNLWEVRKAGLNIMMSLKGDGKPVSFIEDCAVPLEHLAEYTDALTEVFTQHGTRGTWYAHASVGTLHVRPILDMRRDGATKMRAIAEEAAVLVKRFKGAFSGEHGDGISRGEWVQWQFGPKLNEALIAIKNAFDPNQLFNPGKIVHTPKMDDQSLFRFSPQYQVIPLKTSLDWSAWNVQNNPMTEEVSGAGTGQDPAQGFAKAVEMCNNNGHCRKFDTGTMCPSYRVTRDEQHVTRGRANTLRLALSNQLDSEAFIGSAVKEAMDLCVSCKGCKRECPTGVDMAKMKIEFLSHYKAKHGFTLRDRLIAHLPQYASWISRIPFLASLMNVRNRIPILAKFIEKMTGISASRTLPKWRSDTIWKNPMAKNPPEIFSQSKKPVVLWADTFNGYFEPENILAAKNVLEANGYSVHIPMKAQGHYCCGRTFLSSGMIDQATASAQELLEVLLPFATQGIPIIGLEPSCLLSLRDEFLVMGLGDGAQIIEKNSSTFEEFLLKEYQCGDFKPNFTPAAQEMLIHGHCHQKAFDVVTPMQILLGLIPNANPQLIETSCCGMAGNFGYEVEHQEISMQMAELQLLPAIRKATNKLIVADGTSCRHQILDGTNRHAIHLAVVLEKHLPKKITTPQ
jgi:FAD/FMN-containing dehydrogenase/Fe-S oxidoreductase